MRVASAQNQPLAWPRRGANAPWGPDVKPEPVKGMGTIKEIGQNGVMLVEGSGNNQWQVMFQPQAKIVYSASADQSWLQPGMFVCFTAKIDHRGKLESSLSSVQVVSPGYQNQPGLVPEGGDKNDAPAAGGLFTDENAVKEKPKKKAEAPPQNAVYVVTGRLVSFRNHKMMISAGDVTLNAELDEKAKVSVDYSDLTLLQQGDKVSFDGQAHPMQKTQVWANKADISAEKPFTADPRTVKKKSVRETKATEAKAEKKAVESDNKTGG